MAEWECEAQLGSGGFGIVHVWRHTRTGQRFALKKCKFGSDITLTEKHKAAWGKEVDIMLRLEHPGVVSCIPTPEGLDPGSSSLPSLCMEYCESGDLRRLLNMPRSCRGLPEGQVLAVLNDVTSALGYLHNRRIIHRDLKPENVVLKQEETRLVYKLIDLGYAKELGVSSLAQSFVGTLQYVAPELFLGHDYTKSVDYWSLGLLCHEIVTGQRPFLPNMSPGHWIDHVETKRYEHISAVQSLEGRVEFHSRLAGETQVSPLLARGLETWLRPLLDWRPETRGKDGDDNVTVFTQLNTLLSQARVSVSCLSSGRTLQLPCREGDTLASLAQAIAQEEGAAPGSQLLLLPGGHTGLPHGQSLTSLLSSPPPHLYLLSLQQPGPARQEFLQASLAIPALVSAFLRDPRASVADYHLKKMFIHGYHLIAEQERILSWLAAGLESLGRLLQTQIRDIRTSSSSLSPRRQRLEARHGLYMESLQHDFTRYEEQSVRRERVTSGRMVQHWRDTAAELDRLVTEVVERVSLVEGEAARLEEPEETVVKGDPELEELVARSLEAYTALRRERPAARGDSSARQTAQLVVRMLKRRETVKQAAHTRLVKLRETALQARDLQLAVQLLDTDLAQTERAVTRAQTRRQSDVWTLLAAAVRPLDSYTHSRADSVSGSSSSRGSSAGAGGPEQPGVSSESGISSGSGVSSGPGSESRSMCEPSGPSPASPPSPLPPWLEEGGSLEPGLDGGESDRALQENRRLMELWGEA